MFAGMENLKENHVTGTNRENQKKMLLSDIFTPGFAVAQDYGTSGNLNSQFYKYIEYKNKDDNDTEGPSYRFMFADHEDCPYIPWGLKDNEPFLYLLEIMHSGQCGAIIQRLSNMMTKQGVWHEVVFPQGYKITEAEQKRVNETIAKVKGIYARLGIYNSGIGKDENGNYTDVHAQSAVIDIVNNLIIFNIAPVLISSKRTSANGENLKDRDFWQFTSVISVKGELFRLGTMEYVHTINGGVRRYTPFVYMLPKPSFVKSDQKPQIIDVMTAMNNKAKYKKNIIKVPAFNPNKAVVDEKGKRIAIKGKNLIECWTIKMDGAFDTGTYPIPVHSLGSFRNYRIMDYQISLLLNNTIVRGQHIRGIVRVYDIAYNSLDAQIDTGMDVLQALKNRWEKDKQQVLKIFTGTANAGGIIVLPGMVPSDAPQKHGTIEFTPINTTFDTSLIESVYATIKLELLSAFGIIDPRIVGVQLGKAGNLSDQATLLEVAMDITKEFLEAYVTVVNNFLSSFNEMAGIYHETGTGEKIGVNSGISIDTPYLKLFTNEMINMMKLAAAHPNEVRYLLGWESKPDEELSHNLTLQWQNLNTSSTYVNTPSS